MVDKQVEVGRIHGVKLRSKTGIPYMNFGKNLGVFAL